VTHEISDLLTYKILGFLGFVIVKCYRPELNGANDNECPYLKTRAQKKHESFLELFGTWLTAQHLQGQLIGEY
jgi:hypothetical protein